VQKFTTNLLGWQLTIHSFCISVT